MRITFFKSIGRGLVNNIFYLIITVSTDNKQLLDEVEHDIMNYQNRGPCYMLKPSVSAENTDLGFDNS